MIGIPVASSAAPAPTAGGVNDSTTTTTTTTRCSRSSIDPRVATTGSAAATASVKTAGSNVLLPSGNTTNNSTAPCRCILPNTGNSQPCNGCRSRVTVTNDGKSSIPVVSRGFLRRNLAPGAHGSGAPTSRDNRVLALVKAFLKAGILGEDRMLRENNTGTRQGSILSPLLSNVALSVLDEHIARAPGGPGIGKVAAPKRRRHGLPNYRLVRYADDWCLTVHGTQADAVELREEIAGVLTTMALRLSQEKTLITHIDDGLVREAARGNGPVERPQRASGRLRQTDAAVRRGMTSSPFSVSTEGVGLAEHPVQCVSGPRGSPTAASARRRRRRTRCRPAPCRRRRASRPG